MLEHRRRWQWEEVVRLKQTRVPSLSRCRCSRNAVPMCPPKLPSKDLLLDFFQRLQSLRTLTSPQSKTYKVPKRPFEAARLDAELKVSEFGWM